MHTPGQAILWQIAWRPRWALAAAGLYLLGAIVLIHVLPKNLTIQLGDESVPAVAWFLGMPGLLTSIMLIAAFSMSGHDIKDSGFTTHMFVLPIRVRTLVAWPMFSGCITVAGVWLITAALVFRPGGIDAPLWWPAGAIVAFLAAFQAVTWTPFAQRWMQLAVLIAIHVVPILVLILLVRLNVQLSDLMIGLLELSVVPVAYVAAVSGVARARRGDPYDWRLWNRFVEWITTRQSRARRPFSSWQTAQIWFECRSHVWTLPLFVGSILCCAVFMPFVEPDNVELGWRFLGILLAAPLFIAVAAGGTLGNLHDPYSKTDTATFVLTRPISTWSLVRGKLVAAAISTGLTWAVILFGISLLLLLRWDFLNSIVEGARHFPVWKAVGLPLLLLVLLVVMTWKNTIENLWIVLTGRPWVASANITAAVVLMTCVIGGGFWIYFHPQWQPLALATGPWLIGLLLVLKALLAVAILWRLDRLRVIRRQAAAALAGLWCLVVLGLCVLACLLVPAERVSIGSILPGIALLVPFSRLAGAPLALAWNRHR
jgi:hypothetical protein